MRRRTLSHASRKGQRTSSHKGRITPEPTRSPVIATLLPQSFEPTSVLIFNALCGFVQRNNWILGMFFPQLYSLFISSQNVVFASLVVTIFLPGFAAFVAHKAFAFWASCGLFTPQPCSFHCKTHTFLPSLLLRCLCTTPGRRHTSQHQPREGTIFLAQCG